jgi:hypothetical protein
MNQTFSRAVGVAVDLHPSMALNGMTTMRLHRLHLSSNVWPLTFAMSWPHSQRVSDMSAIACDEELSIVDRFLDIENNY